MLKIGIVGNGPMELVQAPPVAEIEAVTRDFKADDQPLAGYVQDDTKVFATNLRPRRAGIAEIPAVPFSFFDPDAESFETVYSDPISISVGAAETLSLDSIVSNKSARRMNSTQDDSVNPVWVAELENDFSDEVLQSRSSVKTSNQLWRYFVVGPMLIWLSLVLIRCLKPVLAPSNFRSVSSQCQSEIKNANNADDLMAALVKRIEANSKRKSKVTSSPSTPFESAKRSIGALRVQGHSEMASELESFFNQIHNAPNQTDAGFSAYQDQAAEWIERLDATFERNQEQVRRRETKKSRGGARSGLARILFWVLLGLLSGTDAADAIAQNQQVDQSSAARLTSEQLKSVLDDANHNYQRGQNLVKTDQAEARDAFEVAMKKYQLLVDSGVSNSQLFLNLGNAYLQYGNLGHAIANYHQALRLQPSNRQAKNNLRFATGQIQEQTQSTDAAMMDSESPNESEVTRSSDAAAEASESFSFDRVLNQWVTFLGPSVFQIGLAVASVLFWGVLIARFWIRFPAWKFAVIPLLMLVFTGAVLLHQGSQAESTLGILVVKTAGLRAGDGQEFQVRHQLQSVEGHSVEVLSQRGDWLNVKTKSDQQGWLTAEEVVAID